MANNRASNRQLVNRLADQTNKNFQNFQNEIRRLYVGIDNTYQRTKFAAYWPWPISAILFWRAEYKAKKAIALEQLVAAEEAKDKALKAAAEEPQQQIAVPDKTIVGPNGEAL